MHEVYIGLPTIHTSSGRTAHLIALASQTMRRVLVDYARARRTAKRDTSLVSVALARGVAATTKCDVDIIVLDTALSKLEAMDPRLTNRGTEVFGGLTNSEVADVLRISQTTVDRNRATATAWLRCELQ